jgi:imidazolonepropionase-like amidohydrolase
MAVTTGRTRLAPLRRTLGLAWVGVTIACTGGRTAVVPAPPPAAAVPLVLDGVTVIDVQQGRQLLAQRVVIVGNRIRTVGRVDAVRVPPGARVVDARGKYLIPGLWDLHTHSARYTEASYPLFIANGVTGIRDAGSPVPLDTLTEWRREILAGLRVGPPRQILSGQSITDEVPVCNRRERQRENLMQTCVVGAADTRHVVDSLQAAGADMIKPREVSRATYFVIAAEARRLGIPFGGHAEQETAIEASDSGASIIDHLQSKMGDAGIGVICWGTTATVKQCQPVAEQFRHQGTWLVPTLSQYSSRVGTYAQSLLTRSADRIQAFWTGSLLHGNWLRDAASAGPSDASHSGSLGGMRIMQRVGLPLLAGTDVSADGPQTGLGFSLHTELAIYVAEGLTPLAALQSATLNPAKLLHATDSLGTVASGKLADLVLLDANPLADITNTTTIRAVVANGRYFDRAALDTLLTHLQARARQVP